MDMTKLTIPQNIFYYYEVATHVLFRMKGRWPKRDFYLCKTLGKAIKNEGVIKLETDLDQ